MPLNDLLPELLKLTPEEMVQAIEILRNEITHHQPTPTTSQTIYEIWSPQVTPETARQLLDMLHEDTAKHG